MKLSAVIDIWDHRVSYIRYEYDTVADLHSVVTWGVYPVAYRPTLCEGSAGEVASALAPYRGHPDVNELFTWLVS